MTWSRAELPRQFVHFCAVGGVNTAIHLAIVVALVEWAGTHPVLANAIAFGGANAFSFWANSRYTFRTPVAVGRWLRFVLVSLAGLALASACSALAALQDWHYLAGVALTFVVMPLLSFTANRYWTWR